MTDFLRSTVFNLLLYAVTAVLCILCLPGLLLPRHLAMKIPVLFVRTVYFLERYVLGLDYELRGIENLPASGSYIVAAKHQSAYETFKLHILWPDPAVVLKRELLRIPLWGRYLAMIRPIAIDRKSGKEAMTQIIEGARAIQPDGRAIIIFPQGTRVGADTTTAEKPYRIGVARMQEQTGMSIVPMALNSGVFWPKHKWTKRGGKVVFEFLPPIMPGEDAKTVINRLETILEQASVRLREEARSAS